MSEGREMVRAYHWMHPGLLAGSGSEPAWTVGETRTYDGPIVLCESGYHSSTSWLAGLEYAPGPVACLVEVSEPVQSDATKQVSATRTLVAARDVTRELRLFVCDCAERTLTRERGQGREPDARSWAAIEVARRHADGKATDNELAAARYAQWDWQRQHLAELLDPLFAEVGT